VIVLTDDWQKSQLARAVPGAFFDRDGHRAWVLEDPTPRAASVALRLFPQLHNTHPELVKLRDETLVDIRPVDYATPWVQEDGARRLAAPRVRKVLGDLGWSLFDYQEIDLAYAAAILRHHKGYYLGWERGLGKTLATCVLFDELDVQTAMVVCPNTAKDSVWRAELERFCPWLKVLVMPNSKPKRERLLEQIKELHAAGVPFVLVTHYESLAVVAGKINGKLGDGWAKLGIAWDLKVADEGHRLANPKAQMTKAYKRVPRDMDLMLSGTIIANHLEELFSPLQALFPQNYRSRWRDWNDRFLEYVESGWGKVCVGVRPGKEDTIRQELGVFMSYRRKEDELDLPERTDTTILVDLAPKQRKAYDELVATCLTELEDGTRVKADAGIAVMTKLRQVATGLDLLTEEVADSTKLDLAVEMIEDGVDDEFVVFSWYKAAVHALYERLQTKRIEAFLVTGDVPHAERADRIARFQAGERRVFIGTLATLGESVNLQRANNAIFLDRSWNPGTNTQAADRIYRQGQKRKTTITHLVARNTVDELAVLPALANKEALRAAILGGS
jgi:SNF2 family DNA or RNA helicase